MICHTFAFGTFATSINTVLHECQKIFFFSPFLCLIEFFFIIINAFKGALLAFFTLPTTLTTFLKTISTFGMIFSSSYSFFLFIFFSLFCHEWPLSKKNLIGNEIFPRKINLFFQLFAFIILKMNIFDLRLFFKKVIFLKVFFFNAFKILQGSKRSSKQGQCILHETKLLSF